jgi:alkaline phosphatase
MCRKPTRVLLFIALIVLGICLPGSVQAQPKYVIFLIGDGMGFEQVKAAGMYAYGQPGTLSFESFDFRGELTNAPAGGGITDSAAAGTALATGVKVSNGVISMALPGDGAELETLLEYCKAQGKSTGLVSTDNITAATPAAFGAHEPSRNNIAQIADDYRTQTRPNVLLGGGGNGMSVQAFEAAGYTVVTDRDAMQALDTENIDMVCGQFGNGPLPFEPDMGPMPHLTQMAETALHILDNDPDGFFLMVECGQIDHAGHSNLTPNMVFETVEFDNAVQAAIAWAQGRTDTLIIVTADHETGGLTVLANNGAGVLPTVRWSAGDHSAAHVPVYAWGVNADMIGGVMDNTQLFSVVTAGPVAWKPDPADGAVFRQTEAKLSWSPGTGAATHNVYFGESFDDVNDGAAQTFLGNQAETTLYVGFFGFAYPNGLVPGTTYYWRVDEIKADGITTHKGPVWSFTIPPSTAFDPNPPDGAKFVDTNVRLSCTQGTKAKLHYVYFGDNFDNVNAGIGGTSKGMFPLTFAYSPGPLEFEKTYYWRIDEFDGAKMYKGAVWSFTTARAGGGLRADYYQWTGNPYGLAPSPAASAFRTAVLSRTDAQINFDWGVGSPDPSVKPDNFSAIWSGEIEAAFSELHTFCLNTGGGVKLWVNDTLILDNWKTHAVAEVQSTPIELVAGQRYPIVMWWFENIGFATAELRWQSPHTPKQLVPQAALWPAARAGCPSPADGDAAVTPASVLSWAAGENAVQHDLYFGTGQAAVADAGLATAGIYRGRQAQATYTPPENLEFGRSYYWRVDEVNADGTVSKGQLWSFAVADYLLVDDFEDYTDETPNRVFETWIDGSLDPANGSVIGYPDSNVLIGEHFAETRIVHSDGQSMPYFYDNGPGFSEAVMGLVRPRDWTRYGVGVLSLWFRGYPASVGSFTEEPDGSYTMTAAGADIWNRSDEFHFAYREFSGAGSISARVDSLELTDGWAKAGVMIRNTLDADSADVMVYVTPDGRLGVQVRFMRGDISYGGASDPGMVTGPHWLKLTRQGNDIIPQHSWDGVKWENVLGVPSVGVPMNRDAYMGLAVTSHNPRMSCTAKFSGLDAPKSRNPQWKHQDIGITSNVAEPMYVTVGNNTGATAVVYHEDANAATIDAWTQWTIPLGLFAAQGVDLTRVDTVGIGFGGKSNPQPGGSGIVYFDDIRLYRPGTTP